MNDAWIGFGGVLIGGLITAGFTWLLDGLKSKRDEKVYLKRKREESYLKAIELVRFMNHAVKPHPTIAEAQEVLVPIKEKRAVIDPYILLYGSENIKKSYLSITVIPEHIALLLDESDVSFFEKRVQLFTSLSSQSENFLSDIRKELEI